MAVKNNLKLIFAYFLLNIKKEWQYKASFIMQIITMTLNDLLFIIQWIIIFSLVDNIGGYTFKETMLIWSVSASGFGFSQIFFAGAWKIKDYVYDGKLDVFLTQPKNVLINICCSYINISGIGDFLYSFVVLFIIKAPWWWFFILLPVSIISGLIFVSMYVVYVSLCFRVKGGEALARAVESTTTKVSTYPPTIFSNVVKVIFCTLIPVVFFAFVPVEYIFLNFNILAFLLYLLVAVFWVLLAFKLFNNGLRRYTSSSIMSARM